MGHVADPQKAVTKPVSNVTWPRALVITATVTIPPVATWHKKDIPKLPVPFALATQKGR